MDWNQALRPKNWNDIIGNTKTKTIIQHSLCHHNFPKFSIFAGPSGTGKSCMAELIAKTITCSKSDAIEPCGECSNCKALETGDTLSVRKYNMARLLGKKDILDVLDSIFKYESIEPNTVFILEEVHALKDYEQTPFLEELTKIPSDVYIMMCTTQDWKLITEIRNRAVTFNINTPTSKECVEFLKNICIKMRIPMLPEVTAKTFCYLCGNCPRKIVSTIQLFSTTPNLTQEDLNEFFGISNDIDNLNLMKVLKPQVSVFEFADFIENKIQSNLKLVKGLERFIVSILLDYHGSTPYKSLSDPKYAREVMSDVTDSFLLKVCNAVMNIDKKAYTSEDNAKIALVKMKMQLSFSDSSILRENKSLATQSVLASRKKSINIMNNDIKSTNMSTSSISIMDDTELSSSLDVLEEE
jgi:DNA polymerase III gamma/tau subunit